METARKRALIGLIALTMSAGAPPGSLSAASAKQGLTSADDCAVYVEVIRSNLKTPGGLTLPLKPNPSHTPAMPQSRPPGVPVSAMREMAAARARQSASADVPIRCDWKASGMSEPKLAHPVPYPDPCARRDYVPIEPPDQCFGYTLFRPSISFSAPAYSADRRFAEVQATWSTAPLAGGGSDCILERTGAGWRILACSGAAAVS